MFTMMAVDRDVAMRDQLPGLSTAQAEAEPMHDVVQPALEQAHQRVAGVALAASGTLEIAAELALQHAVVMLHLLLFAQVQAVVGLLVAAILMHAGRRSRRSMAHFGVSQRVPFRNSFRPSRRQRRQTGPMVRAMFLSNF